MSVSLKKTVGIFVFSFNSVVSVSEKTTSNRQPIYILPLGYVSTNVLINFDT